ncbi:hypothetical protein [Jeotgalibacillus proteolyticus]|uniref:Uncharacterized protein n=1 Tax=Jeotgalibacillus proteolyticus TaxID=2082395 RepID=A0A2S5GG06_9BACL|nr:hypothetical protein [Jeotgalibacillus proteolyticus]PPA71803.1 hypothetical protein C4B60_00015 [Jeotgalibacillus proteolyticus]
MTSTKVPLYFFIVQVVQVLKRDYLIEPSSGIIPEHVTADDVLESIHFDSYDKLEDLKLQKVVLEEQNKLNEEIAIQHQIPNLIWVDFSKRTVITKQ